MTVMPFIDVADGNWTATAQLIPPIGTGSQAGFEACLKKCGLDGTSYSQAGPVMARE